MKRTITGLVIFGLVLSLWLGGCSSQSQQPSVALGSKPAKQSCKSTCQSNKNRRKDAGRLVADRMDYDFGVIEPGQKLHGKYILTNNGKETLGINKKVGKSCGCTVPELDSYVLKPGESTTLNFSFNAGSKPGKVKKKLWVTTMEPALPAKLMLTLSANIKKIMDIKPERLSFDIKETASNKGSIVVKSTYGGPFKITGYTCTGNAVDVTYDADKEAIEHTLSFMAKTEKLREHASGLISIKTSNPKAKNLTVRFNSTWPFAANPGIQHFHKLVPGKAKTTNIEVASNFGESFELGECTSKKGFLSVADTTKTEDGYQVAIAFKIPADSTRKYVSDILTINIKDHPEDSLKVRCYSRP